MAAAAAAVPHVPHNNGPDDDDDDDDEHEYGAPAPPLQVRRYYQDLAADRVEAQRGYSRTYYHRRIANNPARMAARRARIKARTPAEMERYNARRREMHKAGRDALEAEKIRKHAAENARFAERDAERAAEPPPPQAAAAAAGGMTWVDECLPLTIPADLVPCFGHGETEVPEPKGGWYAVHKYKGIVVKSWAELSEPTRTTYLSQARLAFTSAYPVLAASAEGKAALKSTDPLEVGRYIIEHGHPWEIIRAVMLAAPAPSASFVNSRSKGVFGVVAAVLRDICLQGGHKLVDLEDTPFNNKLWISHMIYEFWGSYGKSAARGQRGKQIRSAAQAAKYLPWNKIAAKAHEWLAKQKTTGDDVPRKKRQDIFIIALMSSQGWTRNNALVNTVVASHATAKDAHNAVNPATGIWYYVHFKNAHSFAKKLPVLVQLLEEPKKYLQWLVKALPAGAGAGAGPRWLFPDFIGHGQRDPGTAFTKYIGDLSMRVFGVRLGQQVLRQAWIAHLFDTQPEMYRDQEATAETMSQILQTSIEHHLSYLRKGVAEAKTAPARNKLQRELSLKARELMLHAAAEDDDNDKAEEEEDDDEIDD